jgi:hypothetical protein
MMNFSLPYLTAVYLKKEILMPRKPKNVPQERIEHIIQFPLIDNCMLSLQLNQVSGSRWSVGFSKDAAVYPIPMETAQALLQALSNGVPANWTRRTMSTGEFEFLVEHVKRCEACELSEQETVTKASVDQFVSDMGKVWETKKTLIMDIVNKINDMMMVSGLPIMESIFSLVMTALMGAATIGASGPHVASLVLRISEQVKLQARQTQPVTDVAN